MGEFDSSKTRISPVFTRLLMRDPTGESWLPQLLELPKRFDESETDRPAVGRLLRCGWYPEEEQLRPPRSLLRWLVENPPSEPAGRPIVEEARRRLLLEGNQKTREDALELLERGEVDRAWHVLEGITHVDAYLESDQLIAVVEGKRTEPAPTTATKWMPVRHQMLRNIDAAWEIGGDRSVVGFFIVEGSPASPSEVPPEWQEFVRQTVSGEAVVQSLPHRTATEHDAIVGAFLGATTWQAVCKEFDIPWRRIERDG